MRKCGERVKLWRALTRNSFKSGSTFPRQISTPTLECRCLEVPTPPKVFSASKLGGMLTEVHERGPVPTVEPAPGVSVRIVAGEANGVRSPIETFSEMAILHVTLEPGAAPQLDLNSKMNGVRPGPGKVRCYTNPLQVWAWPKPATWSCLLYTRKGEAILKSDEETPLPVHHTATLSRAEPRQGCA